VGDSETVRRGGGGAASTASTMSSRREAAGVRGEVTDVDRGWSSESKNPRRRWRGQVVVAMGLAHGSRTTNGSRATLIGMEG
jgi:hypothetical protein